MPLRSRQFNVSSLERKKRRMHPNSSTVSARTIYMKLVILDWYALLMLDTFRVLSIEKIQYLLCCHAREGYRLPHKV